MERRAILALGVTLGLSGLLWAIRPQPALPLPRLLVFFDSSGSMNQEERRLACGLLEEVVDRCLPAGAPLDVWCFGREARKVFSGAVSAGSDLRSLEEEALLPESRAAVPERSDRDAGTFLAPALQEALQALRSAGDGPVLVLVLGDGEDYDRPATRRVAEQLAQQPNLRAVWVAGVLGDAAAPMRTPLERCLEPLGDRLLVSGRWDVAANLDLFARRVPQGR